MADPLSTVAGLVELVSAIDRLTVTLNRVVRDVRDAWADVLEVLRDLSSLKSVLELMDAEWSAWSENVVIPDMLLSQIQSAIDNCSAAVYQIQTYFDEYHEEGGLPIEGTKVQRFQSTLAAHVATFNMALALLNMTTMKDSREYEVHSEDIGRNADQILQEIENLKAMVRGKAGESPQDFILERYLEELSSYAETVDDVPSPDSSATLVGSSASANIVAAAAAEHFAYIFMEQPLIGGLCTDALESGTIGPEKLGRKLRELLRRFGGELKAEASNAGDVVAAKLVRSRASQISHAIQERSGQLSGQLSVPKTSTQLRGDFLQPLDRMKVDNLRLVEDFLQKLEPSPAGADEAVEGDETDKASSEDELDSEDENWDANKDELPALAAMKQFILRGIAFQNLQTRLHDLLSPTFPSEVRKLVQNEVSKALATASPYREARLLYLKELELDLGMDDIVAVELHVHKTSSYLDTAKRAVERATKEKWDWWPLKDPHPSANAQKACIHWTCVCGEKRFREVPTNLAIPLKRLVTRFGTVRGGGTFNTRPPNDSTPTAPQGSRLRPPPPAHNRHAQGFTSPPLPGAIQGSSAGQTQPQPTGSVSGISAPPPKSSLWVFLTVEVRGDYQLAQIPVTNISDDAFFQTLRAKYCEMRGLFRRLFSFRVYHHCEFAHVDRIGVDAYAPGDLRPSFPDPGDAAYAFAPKPPKPIPPINAHEFNRRFYACPRTDPHTHFLPGGGSRHACARYAGVRGALDRIPKRRSLLSTRALDREVVWGLVAVERPSLARVFAYHVLALAGPFAFWVLWQTKLGHSDDWQNASIPFAVVCVLLSMFWFPLLQKA